ncbi:CBM96 family carbohydrate-binding protein [Cnuella takakiae]|nr:DNRLRE domain-containing protein [Cnuella takakiae]OLY95652.1 hypothetical protein BUE76_00065 [Cnuella takakiae]
MKNFLLSFAVALIFLPAYSQSSSFNTIRWSTVAPQPFTLNEGQAKVVNGKLYSFGGFDSKKTTFTPTKRAYVYNPELNSWTPIADLPFTPNGTSFGGVTHAGIATDGTNIYIAGGYTSNTAGTGQIFGTKQVWRYNVATNTYTKMPDLPVVISAGQMVYLNGRLHYIGGTNASRTTDLGSHYMLDISSGANTWTNLAPLPNPRHHGGSAVLGGKIYYIGGQHEHDADLVPQKDVHRYDPETNTWTQMADMPVPAGAAGRNHITSSVVVVNNRIIVLGGQTVHQTGRTSMVSSYDPGTDTWTNLTPLPQARFSGVAGFIGNSIYYSGGSSTSTTYRGDLAVAENIISATPLEDSYVRDGTYAGDNYGNDTSLLVKLDNTTTAGYKRRTYLKFPVNSSSIIMAKLRLYGRNTENNTNTYITVKGLTNDTWTEAGITWNNAHAPPASSLYTNVINATKTYYEFDVTNFVKQEAATNGVVSFVVMDTARQNRILSFNSKEFGSNPPQLVITLAGASANFTNLKVNFQDNATAAPSGWVGDFGQAFGSRTSAGQGTGNTYGWLSRTTGSPVSLVGNGRNRKTPADATLATFMHMQANQASGTFDGVKVEGKWEAEVVNGSYDVTVSVGDASYYDSKHSVNIEGVPAIVSFTSSSTNKFKSATISVSVSDGKLTLDAIGGTNTKINYVIIQPTTSKRPSVTVNTQLPPNIFLLPTDPSLLVAAQQLRVYPNPAKDKFQVALPASYQGTVSLQLVDILGHVHQIANTEVRAGGTILNVDVAPLKLARGVYFLKVHGKNKELATTKLVIE